MQQISVKDQTLDITEGKLKRFKALLPYWGLMLTSSLKVTELPGQSEVNILTYDPGFLPEIRNLLRHTNIQIKSMPEAASDFEIKLLPDHTHPASIITDRITYHLKPIFNEPPSSVDKAVYKNIWLPVKSSQTQVILHSNYMQYAAEWLSYLVLQYTRSNPLPILTDVTIDDYNLFVKFILQPLNPDLAARQTLDAVNHQDRHKWPSLPDFKPRLKTSKKQTDLGKEPTVEENTEPISNNFYKDKKKSLLMSYKTENKNDQEGLPFDPFKNQRNSDDNSGLFSEHAGNTFNPFAKKSKPIISKVNPFKKKGR